MPLGQWVIFWTAFALLATWATWSAYVAIVGRRSDGRPRCPRCPYDMTGAPSLTCPECGHDARSSDRLTKRHRRPKRIVLALLLACVCWYGNVVRHRVYSGEPWKTAAIPTTGLILGLERWEDRAEPVLRRRAFIVHLNGRNEFVLPDWQCAIFERMLFRRIMATKPANRTLASNQRWFYMGCLGGRRASAVRLMTRVMLEHPSPHVRREAMKRASYHRQFATETRPKVWEALRSGKVLVGDVDDVLAHFGPNQFTGIDNQQFESELRILATRPLPPYVDTPSLELYLLELLRRRPANAAELLAIHPPGHDARRRLLLETARCRLAGLGEVLTIEIEETEGSIIARAVNTHPDEAVIELYGEPFGLRSDDGRVLVSAQSPLQLRHGESIEAKLNAKEMADWVGTLHTRRRVYAGFGMYQRDSERLRPVAWGVREYPASDEAAR